jgi:hypothetical protein
MSELKQYRDKNTVYAICLVNGGAIGLSSGLGFAGVGDYVIHENGTTRLIEKEDFESRYVELEGDSEYSPVGKLVDDVVVFMKENPDQVDRIKELELAGAERKGIMNYEG